MSVRSCALLALVLVSRGQELEHGQLVCGAAECRVTCDYGYVPSGPHSVPPGDTASRQLIKPLDDDRHPLLY